MRQKGFTTIEVIITLFIIGIVLVIYQAALNTMTLNRNSKEKQLGLRIAQSQLETLRNTSFASFPAAGTTSFAHPLLTNLKSSTASQTITDVNATTKQIDLTVTWYDTRGDQKVITLTTLRVQGGLGMQ